MGAERVRVRTIVNTIDGQVRITASNGGPRGGKQIADFRGDKFRILEPLEGPPVTILDLIGFDPGQCQLGRRGSDGSSPRAVASRRQTRGLWGKGHGRFRTRGRHGSATVRGTVWFTADLCSGTYFEDVKAWAFRPAHGSGSFPDRPGRLRLRPQARIPLRPGQKYLARAPR